MPQVDFNLAVDVTKNFTYKILKTCACGLNTTFGQCMTKFKAHIDYSLNLVDNGISLGDNTCI